MPRILLCTLGSLGDLMPVLSVAAALKARGATVRLALHEGQIGIARAAGFQAEPIMEGYAQVARDLGMSDAALARAVVKDGTFLMREVYLPRLAGQVGRLRDIARGADIIAGSFQVPAAPIVAELLGLPYVRLTLQPMLCLSPDDPPRTPQFRWMTGSTGALGQRWNRLMLRAGRGHLRRRYAPRIDAVRTEHGLPKQRSVPLFEADGDVIAHLGLYSPHLSRSGGDITCTGTCATVFPVEMAEDARVRMARFLADGPDPIIVSMGSFVPRIAETAHAALLEAAERLGQRLLLLNAPPEGAVADRAGESRHVLHLPHAPHEQVFPRASLVVHHGGIGTTTQALRAGRVQLVIPFGMDQPDNAARLERLGVAARLNPARAAPDRLVPLLRRLLTDGEMAARAARLAGEVAQETGAETAAEALLSAYHARQAAHRP